MVFQNLFKERIQKIKVYSRQSMDKSMEKIKKLLDEMEDIKSGKAEIDNVKLVKKFISR